MTRSKTDLPKGTLDLLVLKALTLGSLHGWGVSKRLRQMSREVLEVNQGSLYPALHRLEDRGLISSEWGISDEGRRAKFYTLTDAGRAQFVEERDQWSVFAAAVQHVLETS
jgi:transcriptional regulator